MKIVLKMQGGLGNQMFQYAFGRALQEKTGADLILDTSDFKYDKVGRKFALESFNIPKNIAIDNSGKYNLIYDQRKNWVIKLMVKACPHFLFYIGSKFGVYIWENIRYKSIYVKNKNRTIYIHGLWQSEKYFKTISKLIRKELIVSTNISTEDFDVMKKMQSEKSVCVHIRRGDFLNKTNKLYNCPANYYYKAMDYMKKYIQNPCFYVFSDDINGVKEIFDLKQYNVRYMQKPRQDYEEFRLMCNCQNFIIANSTFSWWASYLKSGEGLVIAPQKWYTDNTDISGLIRDNMVCL